MSSNSKHEEELAISSKGSQYARYEVYPEFAAYYIPLHSWVLGFEW